MSANVSRDHSYSFSLYGVPSADQMISELQRVKQMLGGDAKVRFTSHDDQRDGYSVSVRATGELPPDFGG